MRVKTKMYDSQMSLTLQKEDFAMHKRMQGIGATGWMDFQVLWLATTCFSI